VEKSALNLRARFNSIAVLKPGAPTVAVGRRHHKEAMMGKAEVRRGMIAFLQSRSIDLVADYVQRGARFAQLSDADLVARWRATFTAMADAILDPAGYADSNDIEAELSLRNIEPPYDEAQPEIERFIAAADAEFAAVKRDPKRYRECIDRLIEDLEAYEEAWVRSH
jgi:hypothetical protein